MRVLSSAVAVLFYLAAVASFVGGAVFCVAILSGRWDL